MNDKQIIRYFAATVVVLSLTFHFWPKVTDEEPVDSKEDFKTNEQVKNSHSKIRNPASIVTSEKSTIYKPAIKRTKFDQEKFKGVRPQTQNENDIDGNSYTTLSSKFNDSLSSDSNNYDSPNSTITTSPPLTPPQKNDSINYGIGMKNTRNASVNTPKKNIIVASSSGSSSVGSPTINTCSASISGGTFNSPIGVTLSCSSTSTIKYCLGLDSGSGCCDPESSNTTYTTGLTIGPGSGNYCLSYFGESINNGDSQVYQNTYSINSTLPNLLVAHPQTFYQTTQLAGKSLINSTDFGKSGYAIGQINLKTHDPSPSAENLECEDIITNYVSLPTPTPLEILTSLDVSLDNPSLQIEIPLRLDQLEYGDNFITSYIVNSNPVTPLYSCSTSKINLNDFEFFMNTVAFGDPGDNSKREFSGGLSPFGFFEEDADVYRGPAGVQSDEVSGQKLQYGMFGMFY